MARLGLDAVWWIVARGNPLKSDHGDYIQRLESARRLSDGRHFHTSDIEAQLNLTYTIDTIRAIRKAAPQGQFVWLMGADNLARFHQWKSWEDIAAQIPIAIIARPGTRISKATTFTRRFAHARLPERLAARLARTRPPAWVYLHTRESRISSTALRKGRCP